MTLPCSLGFRRLLGRRLDDEVVRPRPGEVALHADDLLVAAVSLTIELLGHGMIRQEDAGMRPGHYDLVPGVGESFQQVALSIPRPARLPGVGGRGRDVGPRREL